MYIHNIVCVYIYIYIYAHHIVCIHIYIYIYIHIYIHMVRAQLTVGLTAQLNNVMPPCGPRSVFRPEGPKTIPLDNTHVKFN